MLSDNNLAGGKPVGDGGTKIRELHPSGKVARGKAIYEDKNGRLYQWDSLHGEWEVYNIPPSPVRCSSCGTNRRR